MVPVYPPVMGEKHVSGVVFDTEMGWVGVSSSPLGLRALVLPRSSREEARELLGKGVGFIPESATVVRSLVERLRAYFAGRPVEFPDRLDLSGATAFQHMVWETARLIPYGETRSYAWLGEKVDRPRAYRAVGQAMGSNPLPVIVPCHRVIRSDGSPGGFGEGTHLKEQLLRLEK
ncbi:MAG: methylated-DNA--[protein]-cysteine S-methyltransferase [Dehalococcoidales bacterium]